jgi:iron-regulated transporter 1
LKKNLSFRLLLGRLLTRSGDQAWDFAVPLVLLKILPNHLRIAALYYLIIRLAGVILLPKLASYIDRFDRFKAVKLGLALQFLGVTLGAFGIYALWATGLKDPSFFSSQFLSIFSLLIFGGVLSALGTSFTEIAIANDLVPAVFEGLDLSRFNSRFRQVDLVTEVGAPILAGLLLTLESVAVPLLGFSFIVLWNLISFFPELVILKSIFTERPDLQRKAIMISESKKISFAQQIRSGWKDFFKQPAAAMMIAYALLWLSVLSPHGVLLTAFLQDGWTMPEWLIGVFRGSGALFGLLATLLFPFTLRYMTLEKSSLLFLGFQAVTVTAACVLFFNASAVGQIAFLGFILLSRIGLYGFSLGEMQIRQESIPIQVRGQVNGFANALTGMATLILFGAGALLPSTEDFRLLVLMSTGSVILAAVIFAVWSRERCPVSDPPR